MYEIYKDIAGRTGGDIYIGVVGPVRTGKSTFIKRFMQELVLDKIEDTNKKTRAVDELPQSSDGKTIMTTEPKFVPSDAVKLSLGSAEARLRFIDCVGYIVDGALGHREGDKPRLVKTPWADAEMPFAQAAEMGTGKVISDHSTIGVVVTTDGTVTEIDRSKYLEAEERVVKELKALGKPFVVLLNTKNPQDADTAKLRGSLEERYDVPVIAMNIDKATKDELSSVLTKVIYEFPVKRIDITMPKWLRAIGASSAIISEILTAVKGERKISKMKDFAEASALLAGVSWVSSSDVTVNSANGTVKINVSTDPSLFYKVLANECGADVGEDYKLMSFVVKMARAGKSYDKIRVAMETVAEKGYGIINPTIDEMKLEEPEMTKRGNQFGVRLKASAPSYHIVRVDVDAEINPILGTEQQSEDLVKYLLSEFENNKNGIWQTNMFGKSLSSLVKEDLNRKLANMPGDAQNKLKRTMTRIVNEGRGGVLCILL